MIKLFFNPKLDLLFSSIFYTFLCKPILGQDIPVHQHQSLMRGRMLELPLKPLLHIAFVTAWCSLFSVILSINLLHRFCLPCVRVGKLFGWFWSCDGFLCDQPMCLTTELGFLY